MTKQTVRIAHAAYTVHETEEFEHSLIDAYTNLHDAHGERFADRWLSTVRDFVRNLAHPHTLGTIDPKHFSDCFANLQVSGTQTTIFLLVEGDQITLVTSGYSGRNWPAVLKKAQADIDRQLARSKRHRVVKK